VPSAFDAYREGQKVMGRTSHALGVLSLGLPKDMRFWGAFGVSAKVAVKAWGMMEEHDLLPPNPQFCHYLWALSFMRLYPPNNATLSRLLGGSDPKTIHNYMWPYIGSLAKSEYFVVRFPLIFSSSSYYALNVLFCH
jgi:hypothetical protein